MQLSPISTQKKTQKLANTQIRMSKGKTELECGIIIAFLLGFLAHSICSHKVYIVGDDQGWNPNVDYKAWACGKTFYQGDILGKSSFFFHFFLIFEFL